MESIIRIDATLIKDWATLPTSLINHFHVTHFSSVETQICQTLLPKIKSDKRNDVTSSNQLKFKKSESKLR